MTSVMRTAPTAHETEWQNRPLCCRYLFATFSAQRIQVHAGGVLLTLSVSWALGALDDGQLEVLGAWVDPVADAPNWRTVFCHLAARGVQRLRFVTNVDLDAVRETFSMATLLNPVTLQPVDDFSAAPALSPSVRRIVNSTARAARQMQEGVTLAIRRRRNITSEATALVTLEQALQRLERDYWSPAAHSRLQALPPATTAPLPAF